MIPARSLVAGVPGKILRSVTDEEAQGLAGHAEHYLEIAHQHLRA